MRFAARFFGVLFSFLLIFILIKPSFAQSLSASTDQGVPKNLHTYSQSLVIELFSSFSCQLTGIDPINPDQQCLGIDQSTKKIGYVNNKGVLGFFYDGITYLFVTAPIHSSDFTGYLTQNFGFAKPSYAQGIGFKALNPVIAIWKTFRDLTYLFFVLVLVIVGIGIMLRTHIDARTVMTVQNQIPKIIISLLLITFSYAIAGFLIDLMYVFIYLIYGLFANMPQSLTNIGTGRVGDIQNLSPLIIQGRNIFELTGNIGGSHPAIDIFHIANNVAFSVKDTVNGFLNVRSSGVPFIGDIGNLLGNIVNLYTGTDFSVVSLTYDVISSFAALQAGAQAAQLASTQIIGFFVGAGVGATVFTFVETFLRQVLPFLIIFLFVAITIFVALFRIFLMLIKAYIFLLIDVIFAPLWIASGLVPGITTSKGFGSWLRDIIANLAVFPTVYTIFLLAVVFVNAFANVDSSSSFAVPMLGNPLAFSGDSSGYSFLGAIVALGLILMAPDAGKIIRNFIKAPNLPTDARKGFSATSAALGALGGSVWSRLYYRHVDMNPNNIETYGKYVTGGAVGSKVNTLFRNVKSRLPNRGANVGQKVKP